LFSGSSRPRTARETRRDIEEEEDDGDEGEAE
jgi:hypothetical protein